MSSETSPHTHRDAGSQVANTRWISTNTGWLLALALLYTLYFARTLLVPMLVALLVALLFSPLVGMLKRLYIPRSVSAVLILVAFGLPFVLLSTQLAEPAEKWAKRIPELTDYLTEQFTDLAKPFEADKASPGGASERSSQGFSLFGLFDDEEPPPPTEKSDKSTAEVVNEKIMQGGTDIVISVLIAAPVILAQLVTAIILTLFLLIFGPKLFNVAVDIYPRPENREDIVTLVTTIRRHLSRYIVTISIINVFLGLATTAALWWLGLDDALFWGTLVALLNFAPYVGPIFAVIMLTIAGLAQFGPVLFALVPAGVYFTINLIEAQFVTPMVLGHNMELNPLVLILWLIIWGWVWGVAGVLLAVPLLVCLRITAEHLGILPSWTRLVGTKA